MGDLPALHLAHIVEAQEPELLPVFVEKLLTQRDTTLDIDPRNDAAPHHSDTFVRHVLQHVRAAPLRRLGWFDAQQPVVVVIDLARIPRQVVVAEITSHPGLRHHRRRNPNRAFHPGHIHPEVGVLLQEARARVFGRLVDPHEGSVPLTVLPRAELDHPRSRQPRRTHDHPSLEESALAAHVAFGALRDLAGVQAGGRWEQLCGDRQGCRGKRANHDGNPYRPANSRTHVSIPRRVTFHRVTR